MEYRYCRELKHNYLIVKNENLDVPKNVSYQTRMLERGNLSGFIPCDMRTINNESYLYYEINSMQSLKDRFSVKGMSAMDVRMLLEALKNSLESLSEYLLGMENVILNNQSVFVDLSTSQFRFMYCPFDTNNAGFAGFVDELFEIVDHEDEKAVEMIYSCSEKMQVESMLVIDCISQVLEEDNETTEEPKVSDTAADTKELMDTDDSFYEDEFEPEETSTKLKKPRSKHSKIDGKVQIIFGFLFIGLLVAMMYIRMNYVLSKQEDVLSIIVIVISMITGLMAVLTGVKDICAGGISGIKLKNKSGIEEENEEDYGYDFETSGEEDFFADTDYVKEDSYKRKVSVISNTAPSKRNPVTCSETVVLMSEEDDDKDITLYSRNADKTIRIPLEKLPLTIGKMEGCVDKVISDMSISRIHCRFMRDSQGRVSVVDLGSTNGTFRNGLKLNPQEECHIEEGDEIKIGRICFDCR
ncbi:DUF6382 domain-containing protein [Butyrivibrio sp. VCB2006]|uniref:DUF6382 domain-containing protein n=1 Tax=Butyrivibrio sp. VCB2006 TaxID=1280679 RepID=UPI000492C1E1|nr:DUF6382 domain-containing protein [Butyrivibrio sp. VCB2006]